MEDFLREMLDADQLYGELVCLILRSIFKLFQALV
jgi:hypothetical protein